MRPAPPQDATVVGVRVAVSVALQLSAEAVDSITGYTPVTCCKHKHSAVARVIASLRGGVGSNLSRGKYPPFFASFSVTGQWTPKVSGTGLKSSGLKVDGPDVARAAQLGSALFLFLIFAKSVKLIQINFKIGRASCRERV